MHWNGIFVANVMVANPDQSEGLRWLRREPRGGGLHRAVNCKSERSVPFVCLVVNYRIIPDMFCGLNLVGGRSAVFN
jgi:hypothetical protein